MSETYTCKVLSAGASVNPPDPDVPPNPVTLLLIDQANAFQGNQGFYVADAMKREILAVALAAIATGRSVSADVDPPPYDSGNGRPHTPECYGLSILSP